MVDLTKCQITLANLTNYKSQWPLSMVNLTKPGHLDGPLAFLTKFVWFVTWLKRSF